MKEKEKAEKEAEFKKLVAAQKGKKKKGEEPVLELESEIDPLELMHMRNDFHKLGKSNDPIEKRLPFYRLIPQRSVLERLAFRAVLAKSEKEIKAISNS